MRVYKYAFLDKLLALFSHLKLSKTPLFLNYNPRSFAIKGTHTRDIMKRIQMGDIIVRTFDGYLDKALLPGTFNHAGFYLGPVMEKQLREIAKTEQPALFNTGDQMVIHCIDGKIHLDSLIDFCRCDGLALLRFPKMIQPIPGRTPPESLLNYFKDPAQTTAPPPTAEESTDEEEEKKTKKKKKKPTAEETAAPSVPLDATFLAVVKAEQEIVRHLSNGHSIEYEKVFKILYRVALRELTTPMTYNFGFDDFYGTASTEFLYFITKSLLWNYGIGPETQKVLSKSRQIILPDIFVDGELEEIWKEVR